MKWSGKVGRTVHKPYRWIWRRKTDTGWTGERYPWRLILSDAAPILVLMVIVVILIGATVALAVRLWYLWSILGG